MRRPEPEVYRIERGVRHGPEKAVWIRVDTGIKVMDLGREIREVILTSVEVQSNEAERSLVDSSVDPYVDAAHEAHVGVEQ